MKKNLLSVLILALLLVNVVLTAIMMVSVISTNKKTGDFVTTVASKMELKLYPPGSESEPDIPLSQTDTYSLADRLMIQLKPTVGADGKSSGAKMIVFYMSLSMDKKNKDYEELGNAAKLSSLEIDIKNVVASVIQDYTEQECRDNLDGQIKAEILAAIQDLFKSDLIYRVSISDVIYQ